jgi:hypothetical protein
MIAGANEFGKVVPVRPPISDDFGIESFDSGWTNTKDIVTDDILSTPEKYYAFITPKVAVFNKLIKDRLGVEPDVAPYYFVSGTKGYERMVDKSYTSCWEKGITDRFDAMRDV